MRGPKPKPTRLKILAGNPGKRALPKLEPKPRGLAVCPGWLNPVAVMVWEELAPGLKEVGLLTSADAEQFGVLCTLIAEYRGNTKGMPANKLSLMKNLFAEFGMGPSARTRISVPKKGDGSEEERFFGKQA